MADLLNKLPVSNKVLIAIVGLVASHAPAIVDDLNAAGIETPSILGGLIVAATAFAAWAKRERNPAPSAIEQIERTLP